LQPRDDFVAAGTLRHVGHQIPIGNAMMPCAEQARWIKAPGRDHNGPGPGPRHPAPDPAYEPLLSDVGEFAGIRRVARVENAVDIEEDDLHQGCPWACCLITDSLPLRSR